VRNVLNRRARTFDCRRVHCHRRRTAHNDRTAGRRGLLSSARQAIHDQPALDGSGGAGKVHYGWEKIQPVYKRLSRLILKIGRGRRTERQPGDHVFGPLLRSGGIQPCRLPVYLQRQLPAPAQPGE